MSPMALMQLMGLVGGLLLGALWWGWTGAVVLGFLGWLAGLIAGSRRQKQTQPVVRVAPAETQQSRVDRLERRVVELEARLARVEGGEVAMLEAPPPVPPLAEEPAPLPPAAEPTPPPPLPPRAPAKPNFIVAWFTSGNAIVRVGAVVLFFGLIFLLNYARERGLIAPQWRIAGVLAVGVVLLLLGWRLRRRNEGYAVSLQGAGVAVLYLTIFAAMRLYGLVSHETAFLLLAAVAIFSAFIAIAQDSLALALIGAGGGFLAPILASTGAGSHIALFGYYLVLTLGIVAIAWFRAWRSLNVVAFVLTVIVAALWADGHYQPALFRTTEPFLVAFFVIYVAIAILFTRTQSGTDHFSTGWKSGLSPVDGTIVFGAPLAALAFQAGLMKGVHLGLAYSSVAAAALYLVLAAVLRRLNQERWKLLSDAFLALGIAFATLAIPLALDARWTAASWALEGAAIVWVSVRQRRPLACAFGILLQLGAGAAYWWGYPEMSPGLPLVDAPFIGALLLAASGIWSHWLLGRGTVDSQSFAAPHALVSLLRTPFIFLWGLGWWLFAGHHEIESFLPNAERVASHLAFFAATALVFTEAARIWKWPAARWPALALLPVLVVALVVVLMAQRHAFANHGWLAWPFAVACELFVLRRLDVIGESGHEFTHALFVVLVAALGASELNWLAHQETPIRTAWALAAIVLVPALLVLAITSRAAGARWPVVQYPKAYLEGAATMLLTAMGVWVLYANFSHDGNSEPLPYMPILNAIDLAHLLIVACVVAATYAWKRAEIDPPAPFGRDGAIFAAALAFVWLNGILLRSLHHWADVPYRVMPMIRSVLVQASLSVFWTVIALSLMVFAARTSRRGLWMTGAILMGVVVVKLFVIDLEHVTGIERIVSFIVVGVLMLVIGFFSPVPPRSRSDRPELPPHARL